MLMCLRAGRSTPAIRAMIISSTLTLLMPRIFANHAQHVLAADHFALLANLLDARAYLHDVPLSVYLVRALIRPLEGSSAEISSQTRSPGMTFTVTCRATPPRDAATMAPSSQRTRNRPFG